MTRANARELAVHLIYGRDFTGEAPEEVVAARLEREYYKQLSEENDVYAERPSRTQLNYLDTVVAGVANRVDELNDVIRQYAIGWDVSRISKLARTIMQLAIFEILYVADVPTGVANREEELNAQISKFAIGWDITRISKLARCILQLAIYETLYVEDVPVGVAVSEAVRLAKKYDGDDTGSFVNGILGAYARGLNSADAAQEV